MALPEGFDIAVGIGNSGFATILNGLLHQGVIPPTFQLGAGVLAIRKLSWKRPLNGDQTPLFHIDLEGILDPGGRNTPLLARIIVQMIIQTQTDDAADNDDQMLLAQYQDVADAFIDVGGNQPPLYDTRMALSDQDRGKIRDELAPILDQNPLLNVSQLLSQLGTSFNVPIDPDTASIVLSGAAAGNGREEGFMLLVDVSGTTTAVATLPQSIVNEARPVAFGLGNAFMNQAVLTAAVASQFPDGFPDNMGDGGNTVRVNSLSLTLDASRFNITSDITVSGFDAHVSGPLYFFYNQTSQNVWVSARDVSADVDTLAGVFSQLSRFLLQPLMLPLFPLLLLGDVIADGVATDTAVSQLENNLSSSGLFGGFGGDLGSEANTTALVLRALDIVDGSLLLRFNLYADGETHAAVGSLGNRRLRWIELENGDLLSIIDAATLITGGALGINQVHVVQRQNQPPYLRSNHDNRFGNNLHSLPQANLDLLPVNERPAEWIETYWR